MTCRGCKFYLDGECVAPAVTDGGCYAEYVEEDESGREAEYEMCIGADYSPEPFGWGALGSGI